MHATELIIRDHAQPLPYHPTWLAMREFIDNQTETTCDELWLLEHLPVYTLGQNTKPEHLLNPGNIPVIQADRGGQVTYHGPGQLIAYLLINLKRKSLGIKELVRCLEQSMIEMLQVWHLQGHTISGAPGVYIHHAKIFSLGLRIRRGWCYHGISLNINMDLEPFSRINPCGIPNLTMTQLANLGGPAEVQQVKPYLINYLCNALYFHIGKLI